MKKRGEKGWNKNDKKMIEKVRKGCFKKVRKGDKNVREGLEKS